MVALISINPSFCNCPGLYRALSRKYFVKAYFRHSDLKGMYKLLPAEYNMLALNHGAKHYFIIGSKAFLTVRSYKPGILPLQGNAKVTVILSTSYFIKNRVILNNLLRNYRIMCMPDKSSYWKGEYEEFYPPFESDIEQEKSVMIAHSPYERKKEIYKGTNIIRKACEGYELDVIEGLSYRECLKRKAKAHIFIDQVKGEGSKGGLGKSGIEAMGLGCLTMTEIEQPRDYNPPVINVNKDNLREKVEYYINNPEERKIMAEKQRKWVQDNLNYKTIGEKLYKHIV